MFTPSRSAALRRVDEFLPDAGDTYTRRRNFDLGPGRHSSVSCLSPWIRHRSLLEREVLARVLAHHDTERASKFIDEVFWRAYFRGWMALHPTVWPAFEAQRSRDRERVAANRVQQASYDDAVAGRTGNAAFDHWARELRDTGYLHNHARMWVASIWVFTFGLPWTLGASWFLHHLLDGDPASNTLSWRWVGGLHTRGKTYLARRDNILRYTEGRLDPGPSLARQARPLEETDDHEAVPLAWPDPPRCGRVNGWLVTPEDCRLEGEAMAEISALAGWAGASRAGVEQRAPKAMGFSLGCVEDALVRSGDPGAALLNDEDPASVTHWAAGAGLDTVHVRYVPYGPVADALDELQVTLAGAGISLQRHVRAYDQACWPHARRGFFQLRKRIPDLLGELVPSSVAGVKSRETVQPCGHEFHAPMTAGDRRA